MPPVSKQTVFGLLDYPKFTKLWRGYPSIVCWGNTKSFRSSWRTKMFRVKMALFSYFGSFLVMPSNFSRNSTGGCILAPDSKAIGLETISGDPLIFCCHQNVVTYYYIKERQLILPRTSRSSRSQMFFKAGFLKNFAIFTGKHLYLSLFLIKLLAFRS